MEFIQATGLAHGRGWKKRQRGIDSCLSETPGGRLFIVIAVTTQEKKNERRDQTAGGTLPIQTQPPNGRQSEQPEPENPDKLSTRVPVKNLVDFRVSYREANGAHFNIIKWPKCPGALTKKKTCFVGLSSIYVDDARFLFTR